MRRRTPRPPERRRQRRPHQLVDRRRWIVAEIPDDETVVDLDGKVKVRRCIVRHVGDKTSAPEFPPLTATPKGGRRHCDGRGLRHCDGRGPGTATVREPRHRDGRGLRRHCDGRGLRHCDGRGLRHCDGRGLAGDGRGPGTTARRRPGLRHCDGRDCDGTCDGWGFAYGTATAGDDGTGATAGEPGTVRLGPRGICRATRHCDGRGLRHGDGRGLRHDLRRPGTTGTATAGERGTIIIAWWDSELGRRRWVVGEVGIDGIVADTPYRVVDGALVEVES